MKLWLIIYSLGQISGSAGPLPYDMAECLVRRDEMRADQAEALARKTHVETGALLSEEALEGIAGLRFECEWHEARPELGSHN